MAKRKDPGLVLKDVRRQGLNRKEDFTVKEVRNTTELRVGEEVSVQQVECFIENGWNIIIRD